MEDLQGLLEKINRDGVEKADAEAKKIIADAQAKADAIVKEALAAADKAKAESEKAAAAHAERAAETIRQSARDVVIGVKDAVAALLENLLAKSVDKALADEKTAVGIVAEAIKDLTGPGEIRCGEKLAQALNAQLATRNSFTVVTDDARAKADALIKDALAQTAQSKVDAEKTSAAYAERAAETIRQSARDIVIGVKDTVTALLEDLLAKDVNKALADEKMAVGIVAEAIKDLTGPGEIRCGEKLATALKAQISSLKSFTVATDATLGTGFTVKTEGGRVEHTFTGETIASELAKRLRPDLAKLVVSC